MIWPLLTSSASSLANTELLRFSLLTCIFHKLCYIGCRCPFFPSVPPELLLILQNPVLVLPPSPRLKASCPWACRMQGPHLYQCVSGLVWLAYYLLVSHWARWGGGQGLPCTLEFTVLSLVIGKESTCKARDHLQCRRCGFDLEVGNISWKMAVGTHPSILNLGNPLDRGAWQAAVHRVTGVRHDLVTKPPPPVAW